MALPVALNDSPKMLAFGSCETTLLGTELAVAPSYSFPCSMLSEQTRQGLWWTINRGQFMKI